MKLDGHKVPESKQSFRRSEQELTGIEKSALY
jgi:hypothetical protein